MDQTHLEYVEQKPRYWLCTLGFGLTSLSMALLAISSALVFLGLVEAVFHGDRRLLNLVQEHWWTYVVGLPIPYAALIGSYLLWGRWTDKSWQSRAGLFLLLNAVDAVVGTLLESESLGLEIGPLSHAWSLSYMTQAFGWVELYLAASLAAEVASHLGVRGAQWSGQKISRLAIAGFAVSSFLFFMRTDWQAGLPLQPRGPIRDELTLLLILGTYIVRAFCSGQVAILGYLAARECRRTYREIGEWEGTSGPTWGGPWGERGD